MKKEDLVVIPLHGEFKVAELLGDDVIYFEKGREEDYAWRRKVRWLNGGKAIPRSHASGYLQARMKCQQTCVSALISWKTSKVRSNTLSLFHLNKALWMKLSQTSLLICISLTTKNLESLLTLVFQRKRSEPGARVRYRFSREKRSR